MSITAKVYIARHERYEAAEAYAHRLSPTQIEYLKDNEGDFWLSIADGKAELLLIEDEG
jgi:hypothetical protein